MYGRGEGENASAQSVVEVEYAGVGDESNGSEASQDGKLTDVSDDDLPNEAGKLVQDVLNNE